MSNWRPIKTAPKDGTVIFIYRHGWPWALVAHWAEYPGNPVLNKHEEEAYMYGWLFDDLETPGIEEGFLGWDEDVDDMPTHWEHIPEPKLKENTDAT